MLILTMGLFGAALLYGDGMITPAISVVILIDLFIFQRRDTQGVGMIFGPLILLWFVTIASLGVA